MKQTQQIILGMIFLISLFLIINLVSSQEVSYCCEKTKSGAWCQNAPKESCDISGNLRAVPTSCEATSYCKLGCCYNSQEGTCMENTPQKVCEGVKQGDPKGIWVQNAECDIPQCQLGCCLIGEQAAFVTQVRCKRLSALYGLETNYRTDITSETACIASATSDVKGACVFEKEYEKTCKLLTKKECLEMKRSSEGNSSVGFYEGYLCSDESLGTNCGPSERTTCVEEKDEVYFLDTCGNLANIYDSTKAKEPLYWNRIYKKSESCGAISTNGNTNSATCGNCDYYLGSTCKEYKRGQDAKPKIGDYVCKGLGCTYEGKKYQHGETWCAESKGTSKIIVGSEKSDITKENIPGSRYFRLVCYNEEVTVEPCVDFRQEVCIQSQVGGTKETFRTAACRVNMWQDCSAQNNKQDCENIEKRDCKWAGDNALIKCIPMYAPGFDFWNSESESGNLCSSASTQCTVTREKGLFENEWMLAPSQTCIDDCKNKECKDIWGAIGIGECVDNCKNKCKEKSATCWDNSKDNFNEKWISDMNVMCISIGDCGSKTNYIGVQGYKKNEVVKVE